MVGSVSVPLFRSVGNCFIYLGAPRLGAYTLACYVFLMISLFYCYETSIFGSRFLFYLDIYVAAVHRMPLSGSITVHPSLRVCVRVGAETGLLQATRSWALLFTLLVFNLSCAL